MDRARAQRRRHRRVELHLPAVLSTIDPETDPASGKRWFRTSDETCVNVSRGGALLLTREPIGPGTRILLEIALPNGDAVETVGRVAWTRLHQSPGRAAVDAGLGIEFIGGEPDQLARLERYLASVEPKAPARPNAPARTPVAGGA
jgi:hypothetical protein